MRRTFVALALVGTMGAGCSSTSTTLKRELGETPQETIERLKADNQRCEQQRADTERQLQELRRQMAEPNATAAPPAR